MGEKSGTVFDEVEWPPMSFTQARGLYLERVQGLPSSRLDKLHLEIADAVLHMAYTPDGTLVQEILEPIGEQSLGYVSIDSDAEEGLVIVLIGTLKTLHQYRSVSG